MTSYVLSGYEVINNRCYKFHTHGVLWLQANRTCASEDAYLAVPNDAEEVKVLVDLFARYPPSVITGCEWKERVAIGVYRDSEDVWRTCDGKLYLSDFEKRGSVEVRLYLCFFVFVRTRLFLNRFEQFFFYLKGYTCFQIGPIIF